MMRDRVFQIFQAGRHTAMNGVTFDYSERVLKDTAHFYNESSYCAPLVLGHPSRETKSYGRVRSLFAKAGKLFAHASVEPALIQAVREGRYKNVSASFFGPGHPENPIPSIWSLKHVGFLGAVPPAVRGMDPIYFAEDDGCLCFASDCNLEACSNHENLFEFATPNGALADPATVPLYRLAAEYQRACPELSFTEAAILAAPYANPTN